MVGLLQSIDGIRVVSNKESGDGRFDMILYPDNIDDKVIIIECKYSKQLKDLREDARKAKTNT